MGPGREGISRELVREAERLLDKGLSLRAVADELEIGVATVSRIKNGEHFLQPLLDEERYQRCPGCGGLVAGACLLCRLRRAGL